MFGKGLLGANGTSGGGGTPPPTPVDLTQGLIYHALLNNNADDIAGTYDGTPSSSAIDFQGDKAKFPERTDYITVATDGLGKFNHQSFTISMWVRPLDLATYNTILWSYDYTSHVAPYYSQNIVIQKNTASIPSAVWFGFNLDGVYMSLSAPANSVVAGNLYHVVIVCTSGRQEIWINNVLVASSALTGTISYYAQEVWLGNSNYQITKTCEMSNVRFYNEAKNSAFIDALYAEGYYPKPLPLPTTDGLIAHYPLTGTAEDAWGAGGNESGTEYNGVAFVDESAFKGESVASFNGTSSFLYNANFTWTGIRSLAFWAVGEFSISNEHITSVSNRVSVYSLSTSIISRSRDLDANTGDYKYRQITPLTDNTIPYHVVFTFRDANTYELYINGVFYNTSAFTVTAQSGILDLPANGLAIGRYDYNGVNYYTKGSMNEMLIYNRALTQTDVDNILAGTPPTDTASEYYFTADGTDSKGSLNLLNSATDFRGEQRGDSVCSFDGVNDYIQAPQSIGASTEVTICGWVKPVTYTNNYTIYEEGDGTNTDLTFYVYVTGKLRARLYGLTTNLVEDTSLLPLNVWSFVAVRYSNTLGVLQLLVNGVQVAQTLTTGTITNLATQMRMGTDWAGNVSKGSSSDIRTFNRYLSDTELLDIYNNGTMITNGLIGYYPLTLDARTLDMWSSFNGTEYTALAYIDDAEFGSVANFDGVDDFIAIPVTSHYTSYPICISFWGKVDSSTDVAGFSIADNTVDTRNLYLVMEGSTGLAKLGHYNTTNTVLCSSAITVGSWYHVYGEFINNNFRLYINGVLVATNLGTFTMPTGITRVSIGRLGRLNGISYKGKTRECRIYKNRLTTQEITNIYNYEKNFRPIDIDDGLQAYYPLANNSLDNYINQYDLTNNGVTFNGAVGVFNGTSSYLQGSDTVDSTRGAVCAWIKIYALQNGVIYARRDTTATAPYFIIKTTALGRLGITIYNETSGWKTNKFTDIITELTTLNTYIHICVSNADGVIRFYINGVEYPTGLLSNGTDGDFWTASVPNTDNVTIGAHKYSTVTAEFFNGEIAEERIYTTKGLTAEQVKAIYNTEKGDFGL